jgi:hypothetical protein
MGILNSRGKRGAGPRSKLPWALECWLGLVTCGELVPGFEQLPPPVFGVAARSGRRVEMPSKLLVGAELPQVDDPN